jgi:hypothetical protein
MTSPAPARNRPRGTKGPLAPRAPTIYGLAAMRACGFATVP